jgi:hypothetical protein
MTFAFSIQLRRGRSKRIGGTRTADQPIVQSLEPAGCFVPYLLNNAGRGFMRWLSRCVAGAILVTLVSSAQAQFREQRSLIDWRTFEVPDFGTSIQYPASIFAPAG